MTQSHSSNCLYIEKLSCPQLIHKGTLVTGIGTFMTINQYSINNLKKIKIHFIEIKFDHEGRENVSVNYSVLLNLTKIETYMLISKTTKQK